MFCWACHRNSGLSDDQQNYGGNQNHNTYYHRIVKGLQPDFLLSSTTQVSMLSKVWFTNAQCTYWNKNQVKDVLKYLCIESKERLFFQSEMFPFGFWSFQSCQKTKDKLSLLLFWSFFLFFTCWTFLDMNVLIPEFFLSYQLDLAQFQRSDAWGSW